MKYADTCLFLFTAADGSKTFKILDVAEAEDFKVSEDVGLDIYLYRGEKIYSEVKGKKKKIPKVKEIHDQKVAAKKKPKDPPIPQDN